MAWKSVVIESAKFDVGGEGLDLNYSGTSIFRISELRTPL